MITLIRPTPGSSWIAALLFGLCTGASAFAQDTPATVAEPSPANPEHSEPTAEDAASQPTAARDLVARVAALEAEVGALRAEKEDTETAAFLSQGDEGAHVVEEESLRVYGFMDFGIDKYFFSKSNSFALLRPTPTTTFVFGNLNLYFDATPLEHVRTMLELRLTLAPNGEEIQFGPPIGITYERIDTTAFDYSSPSSQSQLRLGGLYIERAWSEYQFSDLIKVQWGLFLNPFGIWNLDHGSPTLISLMLPTFVAAQMIPTRLLGVHVHGSTFFGSSELGYALHVTNGRTPLDFDLSEDKGLGGRLYLAHEGDFGRLVLGASGYWGTYLDQQRQYTPTGPSVVSLVDTVNYTEDVLGFDVALDVGDLRVRSEAVLRWVKYKSGKSEAFLSTDGTVQYLPNRLEYAGYVMAAYRTPWRVEPYLECEMSSKSYTVPRWAGNARASSANTSALYLSAGFNIELTSHTLFKTQVVWETSYERNFKTKTTDTPVLYIRIVDSF